MEAELSDTICAIATPLGEGGIGIVRLSGEKALHIASCVVRLKSNAPLSDAANHRLYRARLLGLSTPGSTPPKSSIQEDDRLHSTVIDEGLVAVMRGPNSFTGETVVEFQCHGGPLILRLLCEAAIQQGARPAEPGEFTKRAFLNGRLDLAQAEAVLDTIRARTESGLRVAQEQLRGALSAEVDRLREELIRMLAHVEAGIDFSEEDISFIGSEELCTGLEGGLTALSRLIDGCREGRILREGVTAAILGRPNVGKSSILNALVESDRAIVTAIPGTTRDVLEEFLNIRGIPVRLLDTAGLQVTDDPVEQEGIRRSRLALDSADLLLLVMDGSSALSEEDREILRHDSPRARLIVVNKCDLPHCLDPGELHAVASQCGTVPVVHVSAKTGEGLDHLRDRIRAILVRGDFEPAEGPLVCRLRHETSLRRAKAGLENCLGSIAGGLAAEFVAVDLRACIEALGEITGAVTTEDILDRIFSEFCIGK